MVNAFSAQEIAAMRQTVEDHFNYECLVELSVEGVVDEAGHPTVTWETLYEGPCSYIEKASREIVGAENVVLVDARVILPANLAVSEGDRVTTVTSPDAVVVASNLNIQSVLDRITETVCLVQEAR